MKTPRQTYTRDRRREAAALARLAQLRDASGDQSWADDLPEAPPLPQEPDDTVAVLHPRK